ncbi:MAG: UDP-3-O-[3-hydroxymyristoyl] N-acetylglucosamine deacetylase [Bdellovibrionales bacterium]|nr:UDP-3-O-[3-hydroxymyristoyl] N-acetylglucosamine deacetylase [Bdellovibrionales bacterium]
MEAVAPSGPTQSSNSNPLVMIVDDERSICQTLSDVIRDEGYTTVVAHDGPQALEQVCAEAPAVVFLDIWMPGWDGLETLERIRQAAPQTQVVMISGHATIANALEAKDRGAFDCIEKPLDVEHVLLALRRALEAFNNQPESGADAQTLSSRSSGAQPVLKHPAALSSVMAGRDFGQRTLKQGTVLYGQGLHSGQKSGLVLEPLPANSGIHFGKIGGAQTVPAFVDFVESTAFATTIRRNGVVASTIEHLLGALHAYRISNVLIKCNQEVPIFDGSAAEYCKMIEAVGLEEQEGSWYEVAVQEPVRVQNEDGSEFILLEPADSLEIHYSLKYPEPVGAQQFSFTLDSIENFKKEIAPARTFGFLRDVERLQRAGLAAGGRLDNTILVGEDNVINTDLRFPDEFVRHKILDIIGDIFLIGRPIRGRITASMTGHSDNIQLIRAVCDVLSAAKS